MTRVRGEPNSQGSGGTVSEASLTASAVRRHACNRALSPTEAQTELQAAFGHDYQVTALGGGANANARTVSLRHARLGPVMVTDVAHGVGVRVLVADQRPAYTLLVSLDGRLDTRYLGTDMVLAKGRALLYRAEGPVTSWPRAGARVIAATFPVAHVHRALQSQLGQRVTGPIPFTPVLDQTTRQGADLIGMLLMLNNQLRHDDSILLNPLVALPYIESLTQGLLLTAGHPYRATLDQQAGRVRTTAVRSAAGLMETEPDRPLTVADLAAQAHVSVRTLEEGFQREFGTTPMGYLRDVRLRRAHADLRAADPAATTVAAIARRWGFAHAGRFSARYAAAFGETPNATLRGRG
jgi:AraC-like DNA-binding protein